MPGFIYCIPGEKGVTPALLDSYGLLDRLTESFAFGALPQGPWGGWGCLVCHGGGNPKLVKDEQTWRKRLGKNGKVYWLGWWTKDPPKPEDLEREEMVSGYFVKLSNGEAWQLPSAKALPSYLGLDDKDKRVRKTLPEHADLSAMGDEMFRSYEAENAASEGDEKPQEALALNQCPDYRKFDIALACIAKNYRVTHAELDALAMPTDGDQILILWTLIDVLAKMIDAGAEAKKKGG